jgi:hypothetical protein
MPRFYTVTDDSVNACHVKVEFDGEWADAVASEEGVWALKFLPMSFISLLFNDARLYKVDGRMINACGAAGGVRICMESRSSRRKPSKVQLYPLQIHHDTNLDRTRATAVASWLLTAWEMAHHRQQ